MRKTAGILIFIVILVWVFAIGLMTGTFLTRSKFKDELERNGLVSSGTYESTAQYTYQGETVTVDMITDATSASAETSAFTFDFSVTDGQLSTYAQN